VDRGIRAQRGTCPDHGRRMSARRLEGFRASGLQGFEASSVGVRLPGGSSVRAARVTRPLLAGERACDGGDAAQHEQRVAHEGCSQE